MANDINIQKTVFSTVDFNKVIDNTFKTFTQPLPAEDTDTPEELFRLYEKLYYVIDVTGETNSTDLPMLNPGLGAYFDNTSNGGQDGFIAKFNNDIIPVPLPVELLGFACEPSAAGIDISWITANEINNHHFTIERTSDGENYETIATIKGSLNSYATHHYNYIDKNPLNGVNYYRLSQTNTSGSEKTFNLVACNHEDDKGEVLINIYSMTGQLIYSSRVNDYRLALKSAGIAIGVYLVELVNENSKTNFKHLVMQ